MTKEEAIEVLANTYLFGRSSPEIDMATNIAIEALSSRRRDVIDFKDKLLEKVAKRKCLTAKRIDGMPKYGEAYALVVGELTGINRIEEIIEGTPIDWSIYESSQEE